jgi:hypothetical protein
MEKMNVNQIVEQIHNEFNGAADALLAESKLMLEQIKEKKFPEKDTAKAERLMRLGFDQAKPVAETESIRQAKQENDARKKALKEFAEMIERKMFIDPTHKFITEAMVAQICEKYDLYHGRARLYRGDIPEKNLREIEEFKLVPEERMMIRDIPQHPYERPLNFTICAPLKDFDMEGMMTSGRTIVKKEIPDPVVLCEVRDGYRIVTAWGPEAEDDIVVNHKMN